MAGLGKRTLTKGGWRVELALPALDCETEPTRAPLQLINQKYLLAPWNRKVGLAHPYCINGEILLSKLWPLSS